MGYKQSSDIINGQIYLKGHYLKRITDTKKTIKQNCVSLRKFWN